jgi:tRNA A37 threonylcarbamoyladenosine biosynthesis protein TsaE
MENTIKTLNRWLEELSEIQARAFLNGDAKTVVWSEGIKDRIIDKKIQLEMEVENGSTN